MKSLRRVFAVVLTIILCTSVVTFADAKHWQESEHEDKAEHPSVLSSDVQTLGMLGLLIGTGKDGLTYEYTHSKPTRIQGFIIYLRLINQEQRCEQFQYHDGDDNFSDRHGCSDYVQKRMGYAKAHPELNWVGSNGRFNPMARLTAKEYAKIMLTTLGYQSGTDITWNTVESFSVGLGLNIPKGDFTFEELATMTVQTLSIKMKGSSQTLMQYLASVNPDFAAKVAQLDNGTVTAATITSASAVDVGTLQITFSNKMHTVDPAEVRLYGSDGITLAAVGTSCTVDTYGKTVTVKLSTVLTVDAKAVDSDGTTAKLAIGTANTRDAFGNAVSGAAAVLAVSAQTPATVAIADKIDPSVSSLTTGTAPGTFVLTFTEPVNATNNATLISALKVTSVSGAALQVTYALGGSGETINHFKTLTATVADASGGTFNVQLLGQGIYDLASNTVKPFSATVTLQAG